VLRVSTRLHVLPAVGLGAGLFVRLGGLPLLAGLLPQHHSDCSTALATVGILGPT